MDDLKCFIENAMVVADGYDFLLS